MKAIDFAARLLASCAKLPLSHFENICLCSISAGLDNADDISSMFKLSLNQITRTLKSLSKKNLITHKPTDLPSLHCFALTPEGKQHILNLLHFIPSPK